MRNSVYKRYINNHNHWWFQARKEIIKEVIKKNLSKNLKILDFGAGTGINAKMLSKFGLVYMYEPHLKTQKFLKSEYNDKKKFKILNKISNMKFDLIILSDVLEHIKNDKDQIKKLNNNLNKNGHILITVPAYQFLFSSKDKALMHFRRYNKQEIKEIFKQFNTIILTYYNFLLFLPAALAIIIFKILKFKFINTVENSPNQLISKILFNTFVVEKKFINVVNFPFGLSIFGLFKKNN
jgi:SAM-dependent methyltransferase